MVEEPGPVKPGNLTEIHVSDKVLNPAEAIRKMRNLLIMNSDVRIGYPDVFYLHNISG